MNIIKSKYTAEYLREICEKVENKKNVIAKRVLRITFFILIAPYILWAVFLFCNILTRNEIFTWIAIACLFIGSISKLWQDKLANALICLFVNEKTFFCAPYEQRLLLKYMEDIDKGEKLLKLDGKNEFSFLSKGDSKAVLVKMENGEEELFSFSDEFVYGENNALDFSCYDAKIDNILK